MRNRIIIAFIISITYVSIGTVDNLNNRFIEDFLENIMCGAKNPKCELFILLFYGQSYLYGAMMASFLGNSDIAFVISQIFVALVYFIIWVGVLSLLDELFSKKKTRKI